MMEKTELDAGKPSKLKDRIILLLLFSIFIGWRLFHLDKLDTASYHPFHIAIIELRSVIYNFIWETQLGIDIIKFQPPDGSIVVVSNKEEFVSGLKEALYKTEKIKGYLDAGVFKILVKDNFCFIHANLDNAASYIAPSSLRLREALARYSVDRSERFFESAIQGIQVAGGAVGSLWLFGDSDLKSPIKFSQEMNDLYILIFIFKNDPPVSLDEIF